MQVPLFPLNTVLFPGGPLPLRIFEPRYLDMLSRCMKADAPFGVVLIREGGEVGPATTREVGTLATVTDWYKGSDGILGVTAVGTQRFRLLSAERLADGLNVGDVEILPELPSQPLCWTSLVCSTRGSTDITMMRSGWPIVSWRFCRWPSRRSRFASKVTTSSIALNSPSK